ncbi:U-scoloptoxin(16)-Er13a-like [Drosophila sulfurigaster albostrigata]|uniref:U-scoloptoxin(16)-Er13a-like n=1 Tax=Drosophila sulfurigaster albostrigata TaxID=89887 RepID=UPI002D21D1AE|nr:U-scoloptoxin(16)-Er13a-like [Drosophila sulfurigaster albostrigata]
MKQFISGILLVLLAALLLPHTETAVSYKFAADPAYPGKCVMTPNLILNPGQVGQLPGPTCARVFCEDNGNFSATTCPSVDAPPGCYLSELKFPNADYPECCYRETICN